MLSKLYIQNFAIIDELAVQFGQHFSAITGETGAGKSIIMGALGLVLGNRADASVLNNKDKKCIVEAYFTNRNSAILNFLSYNQIEDDGDLILRREISAAGKSRAFINDTPVNLTQMREAGSILVDLHQQFDTLELAEENFQREVVDALANNNTLLSIMKLQFQDFHIAQQKLHALIAEQEAANKENDYFQFLFSELEELSLKENEIEELDAELKLLNNAEQIKQELSAAGYGLKDGEQPVVQQVKIIQQKLQSIARLYPSLEELISRLSAANIELADIADEIERTESAIHYDAARIQIVNDRLAAAYKLQKKHNANSTEDLLKIQSELEQKLQHTQSLSDEISALKEETESLHKKCLATAEKISKARAAQLKPFEKNTIELLKQVGMPNAAIKVDLSPAALSRWGVDKINFLFDANSSGRFEPLEKVASGGELSRLMLVIKSQVAEKMKLPTLIFDEIDSGISGEAARQVGFIMQGLAKAHQVIVISHQPQVAAKAETHLYVFKQPMNDKIATNVKHLNSDERIMAIAKMISGEQPTAAAIENAKELVGN